LPGILTIAKKEFTDHVSDHTFLLCFGIFLVAMVGSTFYQLDQINTLTADVAKDAGFIESELWKDPEVSEMLERVLVSQISTLGVLVALSLGFNSINKERAEGSLKVLFSYPIAKSRIILGKILGGFTVIVLVVLASLVVSFSIEMYYLTIPPSPEVLQRLAVVVGGGILLLSTFLCLGTAVSIIVKDASACLLTLLLVAMLLQPDFITMLLLTIGEYFPKLIPFGAGTWYGYYMPGIMSWQMPPILQRIPVDILGLTPIMSYRLLSDKIFHFQNVYTSSYSSLSPPQIIPIPFDWLLAQNLQLLVAPLAYAIVAFALCILVFFRRDVA
jgi:ABC-type transport system involved in multi-copper enzyme maturation permease subunit